jgi:hypothetical protein
MPIKNFDKVELLLPMTGANNGTVFTDYSLRQRAVTRLTATTTTSRSAFSGYGSCGDLRSGGSLRGPYFEETRTQDFTVGGWFAPSANLNSGTTQKALMAQWGQGFVSLSSPLIWLLDYNVGSLRFITRSGATSSVLSISVDLTQNQFYYIELSKQGSTSYLSVNGVISSTASFATLGSTTGASDFTIGRKGDDSTENVRWDGYAQDVFVVIGEALHTANFTPPARMTDRTLTRVNTGTDSHEFDRAVLFDWNAGGNSVSHAATPDSSGDFVADDLIDLEYGVAFIKDGCGPECRGPVTVDPDT